MYFALVAFAVQARWTGPEQAKGRHYPDREKEKCCAHALLCLPAFSFFFFCKGCTAVSEFFLGFYFTIRSFFFSCLACCPVSSRKHKEQNEKESWRFTPSLHLEPRTAATTTTTKQQNNNNNNKKKKQGSASHDFVYPLHEAISFPFFFFFHIFLWFQTWSIAVKCWTMSGIRVAAFSKYFAVGGLCAAVLCARNGAYLIAEDSEQFQRTCERVAGYADEATALEQYIMSNGLSFAKIETGMNLVWPSLK